MDSFGDGCLGVCWDFEQGDMQEICQQAARLPPPVLPGGGVFPKSENCQD
ncbi:MAG: hypothetical protein HFG05_09545 [Oscillibacter sp.]|nr:hypothetical protein [Oscillibacter sp.]